MLSMRIHCVHTPPHYLWPDIMLAGFLASTAEEYAQVLSQLFTSEGKSEDLFQSIPPKARASVQRFSDEAFSETFSGLMLTFLNKQFFGKST